MVIVQYNELYNRITKLLQARGITRRKMQADLGLKTQYMTELKSGRMKIPSADKLAAIADYLGVSVQQLLSEKNIPTENNLDEDKRMLLSIIDDLSEDQAHYLYDLAVSFLQRQRKKEDKG